MVHQDSVVGDDGSHRLLVVPCALVVLVLVLMVTACSSAGGDPGQGEEGASATGAQAGDADAGGDESVAPGRGNVAQGVIAEPVVAEDGRMLQPEGHTGLWFETEPADPLEKLVYESQRFVGQPVALEPIGDRALLPQWEDMPDPCHPEVLRRMGELGVEVIVDDDIGLGYAQCSGLYGEDGSASNVIFEWGITADIGEYLLVDDLDFDEGRGVGLVDHGDKAEALGCISYRERDAEHGFLLAAMSRLSYGYGCDGSNKVSQLAINVIGGGFR
jgi:hypothetical protein